MAMARGKKDHPNLDLARELWAAAADGNADAMRGLLAEDVVWQSVGTNPLSGVRNGPDEVLDYLALVGESADELLSDIEEIFVNDEGAVVMYQVKARREAKSLEMEYFLLLRIEVGLVTRALMVPVDQYDNDRFWS
jgi:ketosteroid isomerase-like protein